MFIYQEILALSSGKEPKLPLVERSWILDKKKKIVAGVSSIFTLGVRHYPIIVPAEHGWPDVCVWERPRAGSRVWHPFWTPTDCRIVGGASTESAAHAVRFCAVRWGHGRRRHRPRALPLRPRLRPTPPTRFFGIFASTTFRLVSESPVDSTSPSCIGDSKTTANETWNDHGHSSHHFLYCVLPNWIWRLFFEKIFLRCTTEREYEQTCLNFDRLHVNAYSIRWLIAISSIT